MEYLDQKNVKSAVKVLQNEEILALPTETVYGLGVIYDSLEAFERLVKVKQRKPDKPFTLMLSCIEDIKNYDRDTFEKYFGYDYELVDRELVE